MYDQKPGEDGKVPVNGRLTVSAITKRFFDVVVGTIVGVLSLPIIAVLATGSAIALRTWPFFIHRRIGRGNKTFTILKIRTLPPDTPRYARKNELDRESMHWFGAVLRRTHLDELPQLLQVPLGQMSLVGPRPELPGHDDLFDATRVAMRAMARPGCTGLWQVSPASAELQAESPEYDFFYSQNHTVRLDVWIIYRTVLLVMLRRRPVTLADIPSWTLPRHTRVTTQSQWAQQHDEVVTAAPEAAK